MLSKFFNKNKKKTIITSLLAIILAFLLTVLFVKCDQIRENVSTEIQKVTIPISKETSSKFESLTIPYLRKREYVSSLNEMEQINSNPQYTTYLTSYDSDGLKINGLLTIPNGQQPESGWPAIVFIHGYIPPSQYSTTSRYESYVDYLARNGYVVFKIDLRGHGDSEGVPSGAYFSGDYIIDTLNAYSALQTADFVDENNIGLWGHSMGGNVIFRSFVAKQNIPAIVIWAGAVYTYEDFEEYSIQDTTYQRPDEDSERAQRRNELRETHGEFDIESKFWQKVIPTNYLHGVTGAVQLDHAINDPTVNIEYSRNLAKILEDTSIIYNLNEYTTGGHNIAGSAFVPAMQNTVEFFDNYLKN